MRVIALNEHIELVYTSLQGKKPSYMSGRPLEICETIRPWPVPRASSLARTVAAPHTLAHVFHFNGGYGDDQPETSYPSMVEYMRANSQTNSI